MNEREIAKQLIRLAKGITAKDMIAAGKKSPEYQEAYNEAYNATVKNVYKWSWKDSYLFEKISMDQVVDLIYDSATPTTIEDLQDQAIDEKKEWKVNAYFDGVLDAVYHSFGLWLAKQYKK